MHAGGTTPLVPHSGVVWHCSTPWWQTPTPSLAGGSVFVPSVKQLSGGPSLVTPLQLSSVPSHTSAPGVGYGGLPDLQKILSVAPSMVQVDGVPLGFDAAEQQTVTPPAQSPTLLPQARPVSTRWLSMTPSQSSSQLLQVSMNGALAQAGQFEVQQLPGVEPPQLSMMPSQSSSRPLQVSTPLQMSTAHLTVLADTPPALA